MSVPTKTHTSAVVIIPPEEIWRPIQAIRRVHDRQVHRWMPHITMLYPFAPSPLDPSVRQALAQACQRFEPFEIEFAGFSFFRHRRDRFTLWLRPEPAEHVRRLHQALLSTLPNFNDTAHYAHGFTPHLSVGQFSSQKEIKEILPQYENKVVGLRFLVKEVVHIARSGKPDDPFHVERVFRLGVQTRV